MAVESVKSPIKQAPTTSARGDPDRDHALEAAFDAHWSSVCRTLYRLVGDWDEAEGLALEVFYRLHQRPPRDRTGLKSWLYRAATRAGLNALRARQRRRRYQEQAEALRLQTASSADPADEVERRETQQRVRRVLGGMRPRAAQLLLLRHSGLSYAEIAALLEIAPGSVGTMLARAEKAFERRYRAQEKEQ